VSTLRIGEVSVTHRHVADVARGRLAVALTESGRWRERMRRTRKAVDDRAGGAEPFYGVNTGFGSSCVNPVSIELGVELAVNLVRFHGCGVGPRFGREESRAVMVARLAQLAAGGSGVRLETLEALVRLLAEDIVPCIPELGSVGASGDLTPMSYVAAVLAGDREVHFRGGICPARDALAAVGPRPFVPLLPMLGEIASDFEEVLSAHGGATALEFKYDGARIQVHSDGQRVGIWSRRLSDVTASLPDVAEIVRRDLGGAPFILDGEVVALDAAGRPLPFQELMRRFRRVHDVEALLGQVPLALHFFDCLVAEGQSLIDEPSERRWGALRRVTSGRYLAERSVVTTVAEADAFLARALAAGHEGVMAKDLRAAYEPGGRGKRWLKLKAAETVDCVIIAADRGSGRRVGWLSNYHLAVRDGDGWADVGKTFKGLTDQEFTAMTERLKSLAVGDDGYTVRVTPEIVVEVEYNEIQKSPTYPSGLALRFARIARIRDDKAPGQATTLAQLRDLYEAQFRTKGRAG